MKSNIFLFLFCFILGFLVVLAHRTVMDTRLPEQKVVELWTQGRMGNVMFQYAAAYSYARQQDKKLYLIKNLAELEKAFGLKVHYSNANPFVYSNLTEDQRKNAQLDRKWFDSYGSDFETNKSYAALWGFFQDPLFFKKYEKDIRSLFSFKEELSPENKKWLKQMTETNSVSMHIRRDDYVFEQETYLLMTEYYYIRAADYIAARVPNPHFYIFSDDMDWTKRNIHLKYPHTFIENNRGDDSYNDMRLMSVCKHNIIANSSFSWWGAWLNANPDKIVIAPNGWLNDDGSWGRHIIPKEWVQLPIAPIEKKNK